MSNESIEDRSQRAAAAARAWASVEVAESDDALGSVRDAAGLPAATTRSNRRTPLLLAGAAAACGLIVGGAVLLAPGSGDDVLVPIETPATEPTATTEAPADPEPTSLPDSAADVDDHDVTTDESVEVAPDAATLEPRRFVIDLSAIDIQDSFPTAEASLGVGSDIDQLGRDDRNGPLAPSLVGQSDFVVADPVNGRVQLIDWFGIEARRDEFAGDGPFPGLAAAESLLIFPDADLQPENTRVGQPIVGPNGDELFVPTVPNLPVSDFSLSFHRFVRPNDTLAWELAEEFVPDEATFALDDEFVVAGRSLVHVASGASVYDFTQEDAPFVPIVSEVPRGWMVVDEQGTETIWEVPFAGDATGLADGSVVIAGARTDGGDAADPAASLLRLWPDGTTEMSRYAFGTDAGPMRVTGEGGSSISTTDDGDWLLQQWPLPARAQEPPRQPGQDIGDCNALSDPSRSDRVFAEPANGYVFPWTVTGGPAGENGAYVAVYDALGREVIGGGCSSTTQEVDQVEVQGASYTTYGDSVIVAVAEPLSLGGVDDAPAWLGDPIAEGVVDSLASEVKVYRVPDDRQLPDADNDNTFLLVQIRGARLILISSGGINVYAPDEALARGDDPFDLQNQAPEFVQGYLDALAEERWADAVTYIENDGRSWEDRPAFADLFALVGEDVGTAAALERWCTEERDCTRGVANGVLEQLSDAQVNVAVTFEVPGGPMFEQTINPLWTVGWFEGGLYIDGLPQVAR